MSIKTMVAELRGLDKSFKFNKKVHKASVLEGLLTKARKGAGEKSLYAPKSGDDVKPPKEGTLRHTIMTAMIDGVTVEEIAEMTGWQLSAARGFPREDVSSKCGFGVRKVGKRYVLVVPKGVTFPDKSA